MDGSAEQWGAGAFPEQWLMIDLGAPSTIGSIRLLVGQWPAGRTVHQLYAAGADGAMRLLVEFNELHPGLRPARVHPPGAADRHPVHPRGDGEQPVVGVVARDRGAGAAAADTYADGSVDRYAHALELYPQIAQIFADFFLNLRKSAKCGRVLICVTGETVEEGDCAVKAIHRYAIARDFSDKIICVNL